MRTVHKALSLSLAALMLSACQSTPEECDPRYDQGFFGKLGCTFSGSYEERISSKEDQLALLKEENKRLNELARSIFEQDTLLQADYNTKVRELDKLQSELFATEKRLNDSKLITAELTDKINKTEAEIEKLKNQPSNAALQEKQKQIRALEAELDELSALLEEQIFAN